MSLDGRCRDVENRVEEAYGFLPKTPAGIQALVNERARRGYGTYTLTQLEGFTDPEKFKTILDTIASEERSKCAAAPNMYSLYGGARRKHRRTATRRRPSRRHRSRRNRRV
jgi:hypothetical protein